ncbi:hypothetical protein C0Q70_11727 [Pomacea canaliculata]|uniref:MD-2-related lipid-recognition domain-containing protein n=2 Tax=Pomacea canaliculata TaxID=400727 RepID=A0A2T7P6T0_POMCA|nr:hypothetical protein C0Q70_11727 [Pomacea canaliculata]
MLRGETPTKPPTTTTATTATTARTVATLASCEGCSQSETVLTKAQDLYSTETSTILTSSAEGEVSETIRAGVTTPSSSSVDTLATPGTEPIINVDSVQTTAVYVTDAEADEGDALPSDGVPVVDVDGSQMTSQPVDTAATHLTTEATTSINVTPGSSLGTAQPEVTVDETTSGLAIEMDSTTQRPCPELMVENNLPCACPFQPGSYTLPPTSFNIPDLGILSSLARGDYRVRIRFFDMDTGDMLACQQVETTIRDPCSGTDCIVG